MTNFNPQEYLGIDIGSSSNKATHINTEGKEEMRDLNNYVARWDGYAKTEDYVNDNSLFEDKLDLNIKIVNNPTGNFKTDVIRLTNEINSQRWLLGNLSRVVAHSTANQISGAQQKVYQLHTYLNVISTALCIMKDNDSYHTQFYLGALLPPSEYFAHEKEIFLELLNGTIEVTNNLTEENFVIEFNKDFMLIKPESITALSSCFIDNTNSITQIGKEFSKKFCMVVDIGDNTVDFSAIRNGSPDASTFETFPNMATRLILQFVKKEIERTHRGYRPTVDVLKEAFSTGFMDMGNGKEWVGEQVDMANEKYAQRLFTIFTDQYLLEKDINILQIAAFVFVGGGSTKVDKIPSVGEHFMALVKQRSKNATTFSPDNVRLANITGLKYLLRAVRRKSLQTA